MKTQAQFIHIAQQNMNKIDKTKRTFNEVNSSALMQESKNKYCNIKPFYKFHCSYTWACTPSTW